MTEPYVELRPGRTRRLEIRGVQCQLREWGDASLATAQAPPLVLTHGWMDVGASFQFVVDELARLEGERRWILAPDWRGFGGSDSGGADTFWYPDYVADLDALLAIVSPQQPVDLVGHSMGGNVVMSYAGARPARIRRLVNLEGFGLPDAPADDAPRRLATWLDELQAPVEMRDYASADEVAQRLRKNNPRLPADKAAWLARHWAAPDADGRWRILGEPAHKRTNPVPYRAAEAVATWRRIAAPLLWVEGADTTIPRLWGERYPRAEFESRLGVVAQVERLVLPDCGHMLHHDQPQALARRMSGFLA